MLNTVANQPSITELKAQIEDSEHIVNLHQLLIYYLLQEGITEKQKESMYYTFVTLLAVLNG